MGGSCCGTRTEYAPAPSDDEAAHDQRRAMAELRQQPPSQQPMQMQPREHSQSHVSLPRPAGMSGSAGRAPPGTDAGTVDHRLREVMDKWDRLISPDPRKNVLMALAAQMGELKIQMCRVGGTEDAAFDTVCGIYDSMLAEMDIQDLAAENPSLYAQLVAHGKHVIGTYGAPPLDPALPRGVRVESSVPHAIANAPPAAVAQPAVRASQFGVPAFAQRGASNQPRADV
jgi:hypothetical protein